MVQGSDNLGADCSSLFVSGTQTNLSIHDTPSVLPLINETCPLSLPSCLENACSNSARPLVVTEAKDNSTIFMCFQDQILFSFLSPSSYMSSSSLNSR